MDGMTDRQVEGWRDTWMDRRKRKQIDKSIDNYIGK